MEETNKLHNQTIHENAKKKVQQDALKTQEMRQRALDTLAETISRSLGSLYLKPKINHGLPGQKHLFTYEKKLRKIKILN